MDEEKSGPCSSPRHPLAGCPLLFEWTPVELYEGGQPSRRHHIVWEIVRTIEERPSTSASADQARP